MIVCIRNNVTFVQLPAIASSITHNRAFKMCQNRYKPNYYPAIRSIYGGIMNFLLGLLFVCICMYGYGFLS